VEVDMVFVISADHQYTGMRPLRLNLFFREFNIKTFFVVYTVEVLIPSA